MDNNITLKSCQEVQEIYEWVKNNIEECSPEQVSLCTLAIVLNKQSKYPR